MNYLEKIIFGGDQVEIWEAKMCAAEAYPPDSPVINLNSPFLGDTSSRSVVDAFQQPAPNRNLCSIYELQNSDSRKKGLIRFCDVKYLEKIIFGGGPVN